MASVTVATLQIDSDWATFQLMTEGATVKKIDGFAYPNDVIFTRNGVLFGQPNEQLQPKLVSLDFEIHANGPTITFFTGKGDEGTGVSNPRGALVTVELAGNQYFNEDITGDGLNIKGFFDAPLYN